MKWEDAERLAKENQNNHLIIDAWLEVVQEWLTNQSLISQYGTEINYEGFVTTNQILLDVIELDKKGIHAGHQMRVAKILNSLGFVKRTKRVDGKSKNVFVHHSIADTVNTMTTLTDQEELPY